MDKRYQVFVSSTFADLQAERRKVIQTIMEMDCIPSGMELFPAADEEQFEFIKRVIDDCDYYLLIIGGRYGSTTPEGISYTEKEYDYTISKGIKVIAFLHENPDQIEYGKSEQDPESRGRLKAFRDKVATNRLIGFWKSADELPGLVAVSLSKTMKAYPAVGWIRANQAASVDALNELNELRKSNTKLEREIDTLRSASEPVFDDLAGLDDEIAIHGTYFYQGVQPWRSVTTWGNVFSKLAPYMLEHPSDNLVRNLLRESFYPQKNILHKNPTVNDQVFQTIKIQLQALGLIEVRYSKTVGGSMGLFWSLTPTGNSLMMSLRTIRKTLA